MFVRQTINGKDSYSKRKTEWYLTFQINVFLNPVFWSTRCLCDQLDNRPEASGAGQMHTSISAIQLFRVFMIHGVPVGQLVGSWLWAAQFSPDGACRVRGTERLWWLLQVGSCGSRTFPLIKKETMKLGTPNLWMSWKITRIPHKGNTCQSGGISDQSV